MRAIVTGAAGFIGSHVAETLLNEGNKVMAIDDLSGGFIENVPDGADFEQRSINDQLEDLFKSYKPEVVYHLAAYAAEGLSHHIPLFNYQNNIVGTANVLMASLHAGVEHFVFTSSIAAYGHPHGNLVFDEQTPCMPCDPYGAAKLTCEHHIRSVEQYFGKPSFTIFRPHNVFGPRQNISDPYRNVVGIFMSKVLKGEPMPIFGDGLQTRSFSFIAGVAKAIAEAPMIPEAKNSTFNIGGDEPMSVHDLARNVSEVFGVNLDIEWLPARKEVMHAHCSHELANRVFHAAYAKPVDIVSGLRITAEFVRSRPITPPTECPAPIEILQGLPPSWRERLGLLQGGNHG